MLASEQGFTLTELLVSILIISLMMVYLLSIRSNTIQEAQLANNSRIAWRLAQQKYGEIQSTNNLSRLSRAGQFEDHPSFRWKLTINTEQVGPDLQQKATGPPVNNRIYRIRLNIKYPGTEGDHNSFSTVFYKLPMKTP